MSDQPIVPNVAQTFYDRLAPQYDRFYQDWDETVRSEARFLQGIFAEFGFDASARILDCACGVGTQAIGLAALGYDVTGSDLSAGAIAEAKRRAAEHGVHLRLEQADFRALSSGFSEPFDLVIAMDNALPHMLTAADACLQRSPHTPRHTCTKPSTASASSSRPGTGTARTTDSFSTSSKTPGRLRFKNSSVNTAPCAVPSSPRACVTRICGRCSGACRGRPAFISLS